MAEVIVRPGAQADVREAALWYESQRPGLGSEFTLRVDALMERIAQNPLQFPEIENGLRRALLQRFSYAIYFVVAACPVIIAVYISAAILTRGNESTKTRTLRTA